MIRCTQASTCSKETKEMNRIALNSLILPALIGATVTVASADEEHYDIGVWNDGGTLTTGGWDHDTESLEVANLRVFEGTFGEDPKFPFATDEPGVGGAAADVGLELGGTFTMNIAAGLGQWNGNGFDAATEELMNVSYGTTNVSTTTGGGIDFLVTEDYDNHPIFSIDSSGTPAVGAYLMELNVTMDGLQDSETFWIVFNLGLDEEDYETSVGWVEANLVPAPAALPVLGAMGLLVGRRRRN